MRILLTNYILGGTTGSETWTASMQQALESQGHTVYTRTAADESPKVDLAIINHNTCLEAFKHLDCPKIFTSHGVLPDLEQPVGGADIYISVSEEVQDNLKQKGFDSHIIRNGIDCNKYKATTPTSKVLKRVLFSSNYPGSARKKVAEACNQLGIEFETIGGPYRTTEVVEAINRADLVVGLGRTAYEAMACERNVLIYDYNGGDGMATPDSLVEFRKNNCSGRRYRHNYTVEDLKQLLLTYDQSLGKQLRSYILENNNIEHTSRKYLDVCYN